MSETKSNLLRITLKIINGARFLKLHCPCSCRFCTFAHTHVCILYQFPRDAITNTTNWIAYNNRTYFLSMGARNPKSKFWQGQILPGPLSEDLFHAPLHLLVVAVNLLKSWHAVSTLCFLSLDLGSALIQYDFDLT